MQREGADEHEDGGECERGEGRPAAAQRVQDVDAEDVGGQLEGRRQRERRVNVVVLRGRYEF